jgi:hypothetical protein
MFDVFLPEDVPLCSDDVMGEFLCAPEVLRSAPGLPSLARGREGSISLPTTASRLLETAPTRLADPLGRNKLELDTYINHTESVKNNMKTSCNTKISVLCQASNVINDKNQ